MSYLGKMRGSAAGSPPRVSNAEVLWSWVGGLLGIGAVGLLNDLLFRGTDFVLLIAPFGASAVLLFGAVRSPLAQPRNLIGGHLIAALVGVIAYQLLPGVPWLAAALAAATTIALMHLTRTLHPPGGATALTAVIGSDQIHQLGYWFVLVPVGLGALILLGVALLVNNLAANRRYPETWL